MTDGTFDAMRETDIEKRREQELAARTAGYPAKVYTSDGNNKITVFIMPGDVVEWKRQGTAGAYKGTVRKIKTKMRILLTEHDGIQIPPRLVNITKGLLHAYRNGKDLAG